MACYGIGSALALEPEDAYAEMLATLGTKVLGDVAIGTLLGGGILISVDYLLPDFSEWLTSD